MMLYYALPLTRKSNFKQTMHHAIDNCMETISCWQLRDHQSGWDLKTQINVCRMFDSHVKKATCLCCDFQKTATFLKIGYHRRRYLECLLLEAAAVCKSHPSILPAFQNESICFVLEKTGSGTTSEKTSDRSLRWPRTPRIGSKRDILANGGYRIK